RRASIAPAVWMPSCELPARRITASLMCCGRRSALPTVGIDVEADSERTEGVLTKGLEEISETDAVCQSGRLGGSEFGVRGLEFGVRDWCTVHDNGLSSNSEPQTPNLMQLKPAKLIG